jgi:hypothetical protein
MSGPHEREAFALTARSENGPYMSLCKIVAERGSSPCLHFSPPFLWCCIIKSPETRSFSFSTPKNVVTHNIDNISFIA